MPFKSKSQVAALYANNPGLAKEFAKKTKSIAKLPKKVTPQKKRK